MALTFRVGTFNLENLFHRAKVLNLVDKARTTSILNDIAQLETLLGKAQYTPDIKKEILRLTDALSEYATIREDREKLFSGKGAKRKVTATGAGDWDGVVVFRKERVTDMARESTAEVVKALKADVLCAVEVENLEILRDFNTQMLDSRKFKFPLLVDAMDPRGIDVGVLSNFEIARLKTHMYDRDAKGAIFSRDCLEVELELADGRPLFLLCNHLKSQGYGTPAANDAKRLRQAQRIAEVLKSYDLSQDLVIVAGDMNDQPGSPALAPLLNTAHLHDVLALQIPQANDRWTYKYKKELNQIDFLLVSDPLKDGLVKASIERRGLFNLQAITGQNPFASVTSEMTAASDHCAIVAEFKV